MTDLERLFRRLVDNLIAIDPARLHRPLALGDLLGSVMPYRTNRRSLQIDTVEDYEMLVLRLAAGEGGLVRMVSEDIAQVFRDQLESPNPDLEVLREHTKAELVLGTEPLAHALGPGPDESYAPPDEELEYAEPVGRTPLAEPDPEPPRPVAAPKNTPRPGPAVRLSFAADPPPAPPMVPPPPRITAEPDGEERPTSRRESGFRCSYCGGRLPGSRPVNFCPHCGQNQSTTRCPECQSELELGWRHCVTCGHPVGEG